MKQPTEKTIKRLFALSGNICAFPGCQLPIVENSGTVTGEICHIKAKSKGGPRYDKDQSEKDRHDFDNLILLCRRHHTLIDDQSEIYTPEVLNEIKSIHENSFGQTEKSQDGVFAKLLIKQYLNNSVVNNSGNVAINSPGAIQAHTINVKTTKEKLSVNPPPGTIGADQDATRYTLHLITRYNEFASADKTRKTKFSYGAISKNIESNFGAQWRLLPIEKKYLVFEYLQTRILKTRQARINTSKGYPSFSSYEAFLSKHDLKSS